MKEATLKQLYSIIDGRLAVDIGEIQLLMAFLLGKPILTHEMHDAVDFINNYCTTYNVPWFNEVKSLIERINYINDDDFDKVMAFIDEHHSETKFTLTPLNTADGHTLNV